MDPEERIIAAVTKAGRPITTTALFKEVTMSRERVCAAIRRMVKAQSIHRREIAGCCVVYGLPSMLPQMEVEAKRAADERAKKLSAKHLGVPKPRKQAVNPSAPRYPWPYSKLEKYQEPQRFASIWHVAQGIES